ncbi:endonuclease/exonuclease/phosphatase family protein [Pedobacter sp. L105]|uniref:endonuclease/exonuclease/phosphatase family protein n=1 Tax=Pedobacter sp. L105 TaxID=1641871 RepID=UPI00131CF534|nr:endonuclease/exonuclease/phosphatase family protein [Pedobacter sp. L105]
MKKRELTFLEKIYLLISIVSAIALILGIVAGHTDPRKHVLIAFFGLAYPVLLLVNAGMVLIWAMRGKLLYAIVTAGIIGMGWHALIATISFSGEAGEGPKPASDLVRMMTYNVHSFRPYDPGNDELTKHQMLDLVKDENPDIICFQEYVSQRKGSFDVTDSLKQILNTRKPDNYFIPTTESNSVANGMAIYSRFPIVNKGVIPFSNEHGGNCGIFVDVRVNEKVIRVYNVHMQSISFDKQDYNYLEKVKAMEAEITPTKRIAGMLRTAFLRRSAQVDIMKAHMKTCTTPFIIAGDFNDTPASYAVTQMTESLNNSFVEKGTGFGRTYNGKFPNFQIDYISATKTIKIINHRIIEAKLSDHFPVRSDLRIN